MVADEMLVKRAQNGDKSAYGELVRKYQERIYGMTSRMLGSPEDARDASQDIFIRAYRSLPGFNFQSSFATWLYRLSINVCFDSLRRRGREERLELTCGEGEFRVERLVDVNPGPEEVLLKKERLKELKAALAQLPQRYQVVLVLRHYQGLSYRQVAGVMGLPEKTVATWIHRARIMLRNRLPGGERDALPKSKKTDQQIP